LNGTNWGQVAILVAVTVPAVILHEVSHGVVALWFGDDTAKRAGRITLNPVAHVDLFGTVLMPLMLALSGVGAFGYAKPVPVNVRKLRNPRQHSLYVSLAGPVTNLLLALIAVALLRSVFHGDLQRAFFISDLPLLPRMVFWFGLVNVILAAFNALPIPPLDGSALVERVLPRSWWPTWLKFRQYGFLVLIVLLFATHALDGVFRFAQHRFVDLLA
jgi:Zn-dependent protease